MGKRLYVGNLSYNTSESALRAAFEADGRKVTDVHIVTDRETGRARGFAFVELADDAQAEAAVEAMNGKQLDGRTINVNVARERPRGGNGGGGGGARRGGW